MKLLLTGFEPFGGSTINPSEQVVRALSGQVIEDIEVNGCILPVDRLSGPQALLAALNQHQPHAVICLGEAAGRSRISIERVAVNLLDFRIPDNAGNQAVDQPIVAGGPAAYFVTLQDRQVCEAVAAAGVPAELSLSAGAYLCNQVLYSLLHFLAQNGSKIPAGFIHLPSLPQQAVERGTAIPTMSLETTCTGIWAAISAVGKSLRAA